MLKDLPNQKKNEKEAALAAIQALKAKGSEINAYTVAEEAKIPRSAIYRSSELMEAIAQEKGEGAADVGSMTLEEALKHIAGLEEKNSELQEEVWNLEKHNETLTKLQQDAWRLGYQAGLEEAGKNQAADGAASLPPELRPQVEAAREDHADILMVPESFAPPKQVEPALAISGISEAQVTTSAEPQAIQVQDVHLQEVNRPAAGTDAGQRSSPEPGPGPISPGTEPAPPKEAPAPASAQAPAKAPVSAPGPEPAPVPVPVPVPVKDHGGRGGGAIYNIVRGLPQTCYSPLVELSWNDVQAVYDFNSTVLNDYASLNAITPEERRVSFKIPSAQLIGEYKPLAQKAGHTQIDFGTGAQAQGELAAVGATVLDFGQAVTTPPDAVQEAASAVAPARELPKQAQAPLQSAASPKAPQGAFEPPADSSQTNTSDHIPAADPRILSGSQDFVDLDSLDIFEDLDEYVNVENIAVIEDVVTHPPPPTVGSPTAGDELRELIKGRIQQAAEIQQDAQAPRMTQPPGLAESERPVATGRSKFIGGAKAPQDPPPQQGYTIKNIPPEIRKAALILGVRTEELSRETVIEAWKKQIASPGVHPDLGGDTEAAVFLNTAKDQLVRWCDQKAPKLGKKFGQKPAADPGGDKS